VSSKPGEVQKLEENEKAIEALRKSIAINPENTVAKGRLKRSVWNNRGLRFCHRYCPR